MGCGTSSSAFGADIPQPKPVSDYRNRRLRSLPDKLIDYNRTDVKTLKMSHNRLQIISDDIAILVGLRYIDLSNNRIGWVSYLMYRLPNLTYVNLADNVLTDINGIGSATGLKYLNISDNNFSRLGKDVFDLSKLKHLLAAGNALPVVPRDVGRLMQLESLDWSRNGVRAIDERVLKSLPGSLRVLRIYADETESPKMTISTGFGGYLNQLVHLDLSNNHLEKDKPDDNPGILDTLSLMTSLTYLNVAGNDISVVPDSFASLRRLETCVMSNNDITQLPGPSMSTLGSMKHFDLDNNQIEDISQVPLDRMDLVSLSFRHNGLKLLPPQVAQPAIVELHLDGNAITELSQVDFAGMGSLRDLSLAENSITEFPSALGEMRNLEHLDMHGNAIADLPDTCHSSSLKTLDMSHNNLTKFPQQLQGFSGLEELSLSGNRVADSKEIGDGVGGLENLKTIHLEDNQAYHIPPECLRSTNLEKLNMRGNKLEVIPDDIKDLTKLKSICVEDNELAVVPPPVFNHSTLQEFRASGNRIHTITTDIPSQEEGASKLEVFDVSNNRLKSLPDAISNVATLQKVDVSDNQFYFMPKVLHDIESSKSRDPTSSGGVEIKVSGNLLRDVPSGVDKSKPFKEILAQMKSSTVSLSEIKRGKIFIIGCERSGKSTLKKKLLQVSVRAPGELRADEDGRELDDEDQMRTARSINFESKDAITAETGLKSYGGVAFMDNVVWPICDDIDVEISDCTSHGNLRSVYQLFFTENSLYIITVNLQKYTSISQASFHEMVESWIKDIIASVGGDVIVCVVGTHSDLVAGEAIQRACADISSKVRKFFEDLQRQQNADMLVFSSPCDVITIGDGFLADALVDRCKQRLLQIIQDRSYRLLPIEVCDLAKDEAKSSISKMLRIEKTLQEKKNEDNPLERVRVNLPEFKSIVKEAGLDEEGLDQTVEYLRRIGVLQRYTNLPSLQEYIFHNLDFVRDILQAILGKTQDDILNNFPPGYRDVTYSVVTGIFNKKAILAEDVIRQCILNHLDVDENAMDVVIDLLTSFKICYQVTPDGNEDAYLNMPDNEDDPPELLHFPGYLKQGVAMPANFRTVYEVRFSFPWHFPSRLLTIIACTVSDKVKRGWRDGFHAEFDGLPTVVMLKQVDQRKTLLIRTALKKDLENTFKVLTYWVVNKVTDIIRMNWPILKFNMHMRIICPGDVGCRQAYNVAAHQMWKPYPKDTTDITEIIDDCEHRKEVLPDAVVVRKEVAQAVDIVRDKLNPERWKSLAPHLGIPDHAMRAIDLEIPDLDGKLWQMLERWKDRFQAGKDVIKVQLSKLVKALQVIGETELAGEVSRVSVDNTE